MQKDPDICQNSRGAFRFYLFPGLQQSTLSLTFDFQPKKKDRACVKLPGGHRRFTVARVYPVLLLSLNNWTMS